MTAENNYFTAAAEDYPFNETDDSVPDIYQDYHSVCLFHHNCLEDMSYWCSPGPKQSRSGRNQRCASECRAFCGAQPLTPPCSGHGVCSFEPDPNHNMTACDDDDEDKLPPHYCEPEGHCDCDEGYTPGPAAGTCVPHASLLTTGGAGGAGGTAAAAAGVPALGGILTPFLTPSLPPATAAVGMALSDQQQQQQRQGAVHVCADAAVPSSAVRMASPTCLPQRVLSAPVQRRGSAGSTEGEGGEGEDSREGWVGGEGGEGEEGGGAVRWRAQGKRERSRRKARGLAMDDIMRCTPILAARGLVRREGCGRAEEMSGRDGEELRARDGVGVREGWVTGKAGREGNEVGEGRAGKRRGEVDEREEWHWRQMAAGMHAGMHAGGEAGMHAAMQDSETALGALGVAGAAGGGEGGGGDVPAVVRSGCSS
ncbi:unnamed protein product [Closterium sp. NIES-64]|nr:unnamed protein product [Closterium sp. NIES-64]